MEGIAPIIENEAVAQVAEVQSNVNSVESLGDHVAKTLQDYRVQLDGQIPTNLYSMVIATVEKPLIEIALKWTNNNQSKAAELLGISRGTLRKKMAQYALN